MVAGFGSMLNFEGFLALDELAQNSTTGTTGFTAYWTRGWPFSGFKSMGIYLESVKADLVIFTTLAEIQTMSPFLENLLVPTVSACIWQHLEVQAFSTGEILC